MKILFGQIQPPHLMFETPEEKGGMVKEPGNGVLEAGNFSAEGTSADNETPPDYARLDKKYGDVDTSGQPPPVVPVGASAPTSTQEPSKPAGEPPVAPKPAGRGDHPTDPKRYEDGTFKPKPGDEEPFPEIEPSKPGTTKPAAAPAKPAEPKAEPVKPEVKPDPAKLEVKAEPKALPKDDTDIDGMAPKPTASEKTQNDFKALKTIAKEARTAARELEAKLAEVNAKVAATGLPDDVKVKLTQAEEDAKFRAMFELENEPKARAEYSVKLQGHEDSIIKMLTEDPRLKLPKESADKLKAAGFDSPAGLVMVNGWIAKVAAGSDKVAPNPLLAQDMAAMFRARSETVNGRSKEIETLRANRDQYLSQRQEHEKGEYTRWGSEADKTLVELAKGHEWADFLKEPEGATAEQKTFIAAHNEKVQKEIVPAFNKAVLDVFQRQPAQTVQHVFDSMRLRFEVQPKLTKLEADLAAKTARITELEAIANGVHQASQVSRADQAPSGAVKVAPLGIAGAREASSDEALDSFLASKGIK